MVFDCSTITAGKRVWIGNLYGTRRCGLKLVTKVTPTQIVLDWNGNGSYLKRFKRDGGYEIGGGWQSTSITGIATKSEALAFDAEATAAAEAERLKTEAKERRDALRAELSALFSETADVSDEGWNDRKGFTLSFHGLTESRIREIAVQVGTEVKS